MKLTEFVDRVCDVIDEEYEKIDRQYKRAVKSIMEGIPINELDITPEYLEGVLAGLHTAGEIVQEINSENLWGYRNKRKRINDADSEGNEDIDIDIDDLQSLLFSDRKQKKRGRPKKKKG